MSDDTSQSSVPDYDPDTDPDTDATMTAPAEGRPDHKDPSDQTESLGQSDEPTE